MSKQIRNVGRVAAGVVLTIVGVIGLILPLLPGTPFLLVAAALFNSLEP